MHRRWLILAVLFLARTVMGYQYQTVAATAPALLRELHVGFAEVGTLIGLYHISGVVLSLPGGLITRRLGDKNLCTISLGLMAGGGCLMGFADSYAVAFAGRLASGMGGTLFNLVLTKMATDWFARREIVLAMAVILSTWPFGNALGLLTEPRIAETFGWRAVMLFAGALCLLSWLLIALFYRVPADEAPATTASAQPFGLPPWRVLGPVLVTGAMWGTFNAGFVAYFSFVPAFLTSRHTMTMTDAGAIASLALWVGMVSIPFCGFIAQRIGRPSMVIVLFCALAAASLAALVAGAPPFLACVIFGLAIGPPPGVITSLPSRVLQPDERAGGFGVFYTCHFLLQASGPAIGGWILDQAGAGAAVAFGAALFLVPLPLLGLFRFLTRHLDAIVSVAPKRRG